MGFKCLVRDQEVDGSNPFAPTIKCNRFGFTFGAIVAKRASQAAAFLPLLWIDLFQSLIFRRNEIGVLHTEAVVDNAIRARLAISKKNSAVCKAEIF